MLMEDKHIHTANAASSPDGRAGGRRWRRRQGRGWLVGLSHDLCGERQKSERGLVGTIESH